MDVTDELPLKGIKILELCHVVMGPTCGVILADMGAEVYKVEKTGAGDDTRSLKAFGSGYFTFLNRNKRSISLDLKSEKGKAILLKLVEAADVLIENFGPETLDRLGVGYEECQKRNPRLIYCTMKGFMPGPYENRPALDEVVQMMAGLAYMTGPTGRPLRAGASVTDILGGTFAAVGILAALYQRQFTGRGQMVQSTLFESVAFLVGTHMASAAVTGKPQPPMPDRGRSWAIYDLFDTADGEKVFIGITSNRHWQRLCEEFGFMDLLKDPRLSSNLDRVDHHGWLLAELQKRLKPITKAELMARAEKSGVPFAPVSTPQDLFDDPHLNQSGGLVNAVLPGGGIAKLPKIPLRMNHKGFDLRNDAPAVGEGSLEVYRSLGFSDEAIADLQNQGAIQLGNAEKSALDTKTRKM